MMRLPTRFALLTLATITLAACSKPEPVSYTHLDVYKRQVLGDEHAR